MSDIFCVGCGEVRGPEAAAQVFRTGFYRHKLPLGVCCACALTALADQPAPEDREGYGEAAAEQREELQAVRARS